MSKTDAELKQDIEAELLYEPTVDAAAIGVSVAGGVVTLSGTVPTWAAKWAAQDATKRVSGVRTIALDVQVKTLAENAHTDSAIAAAVEHALAWDVLVPKRVTADVQEGRVTLHGNVAHPFQRAAAERAVRHVRGVVSVYDAITIGLTVSLAQITDNIEAALRRQAAIDTQGIHLEAKDGTITLTGHAPSFQAIDAATAAAWASPGVVAVVDRLTKSVEA
jgi:osmotically-inducible protein OsmY